MYTCRQDVKSTALQCSPKQLLSRGIGTGHSANKVFSVALEFELALDRPAGGHSFVSCQGPHLHKVHLGQVVIDRKLLPRVAPLGGLTSWLLLGGKLLLEPEDQGPDIPREESGYDRLGVHLAW